MYHDYFGIEESPFSLTPDPRYVYMARGHQEALAHLLYGVSGGGGCVLLTGEVGTGKTSVCRCLLEQLPPEAEVALILNPRLDEMELLASICDELGVERPEAASIKTLVDRLNAHFLELHAKGRHAVLIVDEAQNLSPEVLEQIRMLTNLETAQRKLLQIILIGQPELEDLLNRRDLRQLAQRISARYHLEPLSSLETRACIAHRLQVAGLAPTIFDGGACAEVYKRSRGVPRLINSICDRCLLAAYVQETGQVDSGMARQAAAEVFGKRPRSRGRRRKVLPWTLAVAAAAAVAAVILAPSGFWPSGGLPSVTIVVGSPEPSSSRPAEADAAAAAAVAEPGAEDDGAAQGDASTRVAGATAQAPPLVAESEPAVGQAAALPPEPEPPEPETPEQELSAPEPQEVPQATQAAESAAPSVVTLDQLFARGDVAGDRETGLTRLLALWQRDYGALPGNDACQKARRADLRCLEANGRLPALLALNRPALLPLESPDGRPVHAVLTAFDGGSLTLQVGELRVRTSAEQLAAVWGGDYLLLWRPPAAYRRALRRGQSGPAVVWLKNRLAELRGEAAYATNAIDAIFDAELEAQVIEFQRSRPLLVDGIVGGRTIIHLNSAAGGPIVAALAAGS